MSEPSREFPVGLTLVRDIALYTLARLAVIGVLAVVLVLLGVPLLVAVMFALLVALPLSVVLLRGLRNRVNGGVHAWIAQRRARRTQLRAQLRGDE